MAFEELGRPRESGRYVLIFRHPYFLHFSTALHRWMLAVAALAPAGSVQFGRIFTRFL